MDKLQLCRIKYAVCEEMVLYLSDKDSTLRKPRRTTAIKDIRDMMEQYNKWAIEERLRLEQLPKKTFLNKLFG